jgi:hypothetical protein
MLALLLHVQKFWAHYLGPVSGSAGNILPIYIIKAYGGVEV